MLLKILTILWSFYLMPLRATVVIDKYNYTGMHYSDYCPKMEYCPEGSHTMCLYYMPNEGPGPRCNGYQNIKMNEAIATRLLAIVNEVRGLVASGVETGAQNISLPRGYGMFKLKWDSELATIAQVLANTCIFKSDYCRATKKFPNPAQVISMTRFTLNDWQPVNRPPFPGNTLTLEKILYGVTRAYKVWYSQKQFITPEMVLKTPDFMKDPEHSNGYLKIINGRVTHMGCGLSGYTEYDYLRGKYTVGNALHLVCNLSASLKVGTPVYNTTAPKQIPGKLVSKCGCPENIDADERCLCTEEITPTVIPRCGKDSNCPPAVVLLPIFTVENARGNTSTNVPTEGTNLRANELLDSYFSGRKSKILQDLTYSDEVHDLEPKSGERKYPDSRVPATRQKYFEMHQPSKQHDASENDNLASKSVFARAPKFNLPKAKFKSRRRNVIARKDFSNSEQLLKSYIKDKHYQLASERRTGFRRAYSNKKKPAGTTAKPGVKLKNSGSKSPAVKKAPLDLKHTIKQKNAAIKKKYSAVIIKPKKYPAFQIKPSKYHTTTVKIEQKKYPVAKVQQKKYPVPKGQPKKYPIARVLPKKVRIAKVQPKNYPVAKVQPKKYPVAKVQSKKYSVAKVQPKKYPVAKVQPKKYPVAKVQPKKYVNRVQPKKYPVGKVQPKKNLGVKIIPKKYPLAKPNIQKKPPFPNPKQKNKLNPPRQKNNILKDHVDLKNLNEEADLKLMSLLDSLEQEVKHIELDGNEKEIFDAKIRKIYGTVVGKPPGLLKSKFPDVTDSKKHDVYRYETDFDDNLLSDNGEDIDKKGLEKQMYDVEDRINALHDKANPSHISSLYTRPLQRDQNSLRVYDDKNVDHFNIRNTFVDGDDYKAKASANKYLNDDIHQKHSLYTDKAIIHDEIKPRFQQRSEILVGHESVKPRFQQKTSEVIPYNRPFKIVKKNRYRTNGDERRYVNRVDRMRSRYDDQRGRGHYTDYEFDDDGKGYYEEVGKSKKYGDYDYETRDEGDDFLGTERRKYYQDQLDNLESKHHTSRLPRHRGEHELEHTRRMMRARDHLPLRPSRPKSSHLYIPDRARYLHGY